MRIKRFNEELDPVEKMDDARVRDIIEELKDFLAISKDKSTYTETILDELEKHKSNNSKDLNEIDNTILSLQPIKKNLDQVIDDLDDSIKYLETYLEDGSKYLLSENK